MPEITILGWTHTIVAIIALISGFYTLAKYKVISTETNSGKIYLIGTLYVAATALMIYQRGSFGIAHALAVLTLLALLAGFISEKTNILGKFSRYMQALGYSGTLLFHMVPAITDALLRLPVGDPVLTDIEDPILKGFYLTFLVLFLILVIFQFRWLAKQSKPAEGLAQS